MIILLYGSDTFRSLKKLKELKAKFLKDVSGGSLNLAELDGEKLKFFDFKKEISTISFLSAKRMVVFKNIISKGKDKNLQKEIIEYLKKNNGDNDNIIVFWEGEKIGKEPLSKYLFLIQNKQTGNISFKTKIYAQEFELLKGVALRNWIIKTTNEKGGEIGEQAIKMLMERIGNDLWQMNNEIDKLVNFSLKITADKIRLFVKTKDDENIFNLTDAIGAKNKKLALKLLTEQLRAGVNINYIITMLARQYRLLLEVKDYIGKAGDTHISPQNISRDLKIHSFVADKLSAQVRLYEMENLKNLYSHILEIDLKSKTTSIDTELLLDMVIAGN